MKKHLLPLFIVPLALAGCGGDKDPSGGSTGDGAKTITIYAGGSGEYMWKKGEIEDEVYDAIAEKYEEDTGTKIKFKVEFLGQNMKNSITTGINDGDIDVVISHLGGGDGLDDWMLYQTTKLYRDLYLDFEDYENLSKYMEWTDGENLTLNAIDRVTTVSGEIIAIPSVVNPYKFGILVRKDWMEKEGYTDDPNDQTGKTLVDNYEALEALAKAMKNDSDLNLEYPIAGAVYEVEKSGLLGAYGLSAGYYTRSAGKYNGNVDIMDIAGLYDPNYSAVLEKESQWVQEGLLKYKPDNYYANDYDSDFMVGKTGIMLENPTVTHQIELARKTKIVDPSAEFTILPALTKNSTSTDKGFLRNSVATFGAAITKNSRNAEAVLDFMNWVYESKDNYELCRYGVKGVHWFDNGDGTYSYPQGYSYEKKPYSGICTLVENQVISDLEYADFSASEKQWIENSKKAEDYVVNDSIDYLLYLDNLELLNKHFENRKKMSKFTQDIWQRVYKFDTTHDHNSDQGSSCTIYNDVDRMKLVNEYLANTNSYSKAVYDQYALLKSRSRVGK